MSPWHRLLAAILALAMMASQASTETEEVEAIGHGGSPEAAISAALMQAAAAHTGVTLQPGGLHLRIEQWVRGHVERTRIEQVPAPIQGHTHIAGYRVLEQSRVEDGLWRARIAARVLRRESRNPDRATLPTLVVTRFATPREHYQVGSERPAAEVASRLQRELENSLHASGKLRLLDRTAIDAARKEVAQAARHHSPRERLKQGQRTGSDLLLTGTLEAFSLQEQHKAFYGVDFNTLAPHLLIQWRLLDTATGEMLGADRFEYRKLPTPLREAFDRDEIDPAKEPDRLGDMLYPAVARALAGKVLETLYPLRLLARAPNGRVYINAGSGRLQAGDLLSVHRRTGKVQDPETGLAVQTESESVATLRVERVADHYAVGRPLGGNRPEPGPELILRVRARTDTPAASKDTAPAETAREKPTP